MQKARLTQKLRMNRTLALSLAGIVGLLTFLYFNIGHNRNAAAAVGKNGAKSVSTANVILNEYTYLTANASAGATAITVNKSSLNDSSRFSSSLAAGDLIMIIQMQGATITSTDVSTYGAVTAYNNCGYYEFDEVTSVPNGTTINLTTALKNAYTSAGKVQVVRVPRYTSFAIAGSGSVTCDSWNGNKGGIVAVEAITSTTITGSISVSGKGFRGGVVEQNSYYPAQKAIWRSTDASDGGEKGESIAGYQTDYSTGRYGRGAPANGGGGGNAHNASGGGGANGGTVALWDGLGNPDTSVSNWKTAWNLESSNFRLHTSSGGGRGGYGYSANNRDPLSYGPDNASWNGDNRPNNGGYGGRPLDYSTGRIFMGGGGGSGDSNDGTGTSGAAGGGLVFIITKGNITGSGSINANGASAGTTSTSTGWDGSGGGGGGGTIILFTSSGSISNLTLNANGGTGGNQNIVGDPEAEGAGGGGGGGYVALTNRTSVTINVNGGTQGATNTSSMVNFTPNGATKGAPGTSNGTVPLNPYSGANPLPIELTSFSANPHEKVVDIKWQTAAERNNDYFSIMRSNDGNNFEEIERVKGAGNSNVLHSYFCNDIHPFNGRSYYRLKQTDYNGNYEEFRIVAVELNKKAEGLQLTNVSPNPFVDEFTLAYMNDAAQSIDLKMYTIKGQLIFSETIEAQQGNNLYTVHPERVLLPGYYFVSLSRDGEPAAVMKVMKK